MPQRLDAKQRRHRHCDGADLVDRDVAGRGLGRLPQKNGDTFATLDTIGDEVIGEAIGLVEKLAEAEIAHRACVIDETQREAFRT